MSWIDRLRFDPVLPLLESRSAAVRWFAARDLLGREEGSLEHVQQRPEAQRVFRGQQSDGGWRATASQAKRGAAVDYRLLETWKRFRILVHCFAFDRTHPAAARAAEFLLSRQTEDGDIRGLLADQVMTYYTGAMFGLLCDAGYAGDPRVEKGMRWLCGMRQHDGGWAANVLQTLDLSRAEIHALTSTRVPARLDLDRTRPFSHHFTAMILRAFAAHPRYRHGEIARHAASLVASRFFAADAYGSYRHPDHWLRFQFPFWWNHLVAALDTLTRIGLREDDPNVAAAVDWLVEHQDSSGLWRHSYSRIHREPPAGARTREQQEWITLAISRVLVRLEG